MVPESKVLHSRNNISKKDLVWKEGVELDFTNIFFKVMILYLMKDRFLCITHCLLVFQDFDTYYYNLNHT